MAKKIFFIVAFLWSISLKAQEVKVDAYFMQDSARLGERVGYVLKANYPQEKQLIFPDSTFDFRPFELLEKKTFTSNTRDGVTQDSVIYYLSNFELDPSSYLTLPVFELNRYDSVTYYPLEAELKLKLTLDSIPEQLVFQENNVYQSIEKQWNWMLFGALGVLILLVLGALYWMFGDQIKKLWSERNEKRRWGRFQKQWSQAATALEKDHSMGAADELLGLWKGYVESLTSLPIKEWTSSEIGKKLGDIKIFSSLRTIEIIIYAGQKAEIKESTDYLLQVAKEKYQEKISKIKHARATV